MNKKYIELLIALCLFGSCKQKKENQVVIYYQPEIKIDTLINPRAKNIADQEGDSLVQKTILYNRKGEFPHWRRYLVIARLWTDISLI